MNWSPELRWKGATTRIALSVEQKACCAKFSPLLSFPCVSFFTYLLFAFHGGGVGVCSHNGVSQHCQGGEGGYLALVNSVDLQESLTIVLPFSFLPEVVHKVWEELFFFFFLSSLRILHIFFLFSLL